MTTRTSHPTAPTTPAPLRVALIVASVRHERFAAAVTDWISRELAGADVELDVLDLSRHDLPDDALLRPGGGGPVPGLSAPLAASDAFVILTPEYNHSFPASLKRAIDWHYHEWMFKPAALVSYGSQSGGALATEQLRGVLSELHVVTTRTAVHLVSPWEELDEHGALSPPGTTSRRLHGAIRELTWWGHLLRRARRDHPYA
ncbi:NADPH-dependent FMN reductase [Brachybacterium huguangmaarense]